MKISCGPYLVWLSLYGLSSEMYNFRGIRKSSKRVQNEQMLVFEFEDFQIKFV